MELPASSTEAKLGHVDQDELPEARGTIVPMLLEDLHVPNPRVRILAVREISGCEDSIVVDRLIEMAQHDPNLEVRCTAISGLGNFIYMGGEMIVYNSSNAIEYMLVGEDITENYKIRYIAVSPDFQNKEYLDYIDSKGYKKISITHNNKEIYRIYDILNRDNEIIIIDRDQYDIEYNKKYSKIDAALPYFNTF